MKTKFLLVLAGLAIALAGCVRTVGGGKTAGMPFLKDKIEARYERPMEVVFTAAKDVVKHNGTLVHESILYGQTNVLNNVSKVVLGKVNQRSVWVRVEQLDVKVTAVTVQTRTPNGGSDIELAAMIDKQIALKLVR